MKQNHHQEETCRVEKPSWQFNLRRISSSRAEILDQNKLAANKKGESTSKIKFESCSHVPKDQTLPNQLASINLVNKSLYSQSLKSPVNENKSSDHSDSNEIMFKDIEFDVNRSLIDQINAIKTKLNEMKVLNENNSEETKFTVSKIDINILKANKPKDTSNIKEKSIGLKLIPIKDHLSLLEALKPRECVLEWLNSSGANSVPNDAFQHVIAEAKSSKNHLATSSGLSHLKCEFIYGERFFWLVKIKRYFRNLFQVKFMKSIPSSGTVSNVPVNECSDSEIVNKEEGSLFEKSSLSNTSISSSDCDRKLENKEVCESDSYFLSVDSDKLLLCDQLRPIGWSKLNGYIPQKPMITQLSQTQVCQNHKYNDTEIKDFFVDYNELTNAYTEGSSLEMEIGMNKVVQVKIKRNIAGRLLIQQQTEDLYEKWLFYLDTRLHPLGWFKGNNSKDKTCLNNVTESSNQIELRHERQQYFKLNHYLECLYMNKFYAARVCEVQTDQYFLIELTTKNQKLHKKIIKFYMSTNVLSTLFPCKWCSKFNLSLEAPNDWTDGKKFDWDEYLRFMNSSNKLQFSLTNDLSIFNLLRSLNNLSDKFQVGSYLECVDFSTKIKSKNDIVCLGQIKAKLAHLIFVKIVQRTEINENEHLNLQIFAVDSLNLFPVGWCEMNNYYENFEKHEIFYQMPVIEKDTQQKEKIYANYQKSFTNNSVYFSQFKDREIWCDKIYFNTNCNTGPYFSKPKLNSLPKSFGPGPITLVVSQIIQSLIKKSEKPLKLIKLLQFSRRVSNYHNAINVFNNPANNSMKNVRLKAKDKGRYLFKELEVCTKFSQLNEYLNDLCRKLKCCGQMLSINNNDPHLNNTRNICVDFKCCLFCTINYFSVNSAQENLQHAKSLSKLNTQTQNTSAKKLNQSFSVKSSAQNKIPSQLVAINDNPNHSPIKTRLNVRETLLQQEELERIQQLKAQSKLQDKPQSVEIGTKNERRVKLSKTVTKQHSNGNEPVVKKSRKSKNCDDLSNNSLEQNYNNLNVPQQDSLSACNNSGSELNPIYWKTDDVCKYLVDNKFEMHLIYLIREHEIDGQSFLMLNLPTIQNYMKLKLGPAIKLAHLVEKLKLMYFEKFNKTLT